MHRFFSGDIRKTLIVLVCLAVLPAMAITLYSGIEHRNYTIDKAKRDVLFLSESMGQIQKGYLDSTRQMLAVLAQSSEVRAQNGEASSAVFRSLLENDSAFINIVAVAVDGEVFASAKPFDPVNLADRAHIRRAVEEKRFVVGEYIITRVGQTRPSLPFAYPVLEDEGTVIAVLATTMHLDHLSHSFDVNRLPEDSFVSVTDSKGIRIFHYPEKGDTNLVGHPIAQVAWDSARNAGTPGISVHAGSDGVRRIYAFYPLPVPGHDAPAITMWAGIPESAVIRPANLALARNLALMMGVGFLAVVIALVVGQRMLVSPIDKLVGTMKAFAGGELNARSEIAGRRGELGSLALAFDTMADRLIESQKTLRSIADYTYDWEYWQGPDGKLLWVSPSCEDVTGYRPEDFMADPGLVERVVDDEDRDGYCSHVAGGDVTSPKEDIDFRIVHSSGRLVWINHHSVPICDSDGVFLGRRVSNRVITDRKMMEKALEQSESQFRSLVEGAPEAIFVQTEHRFSYVNEAAVRLFGAASAEDLLGKPVMDRFHPDFRDRIRERITQLNVMRTKVSRLEQIYLRLDGRSVPVETTAVPITFEDRDGALVFVQDISERKQIEARLQQAQKMEAIGALAGGIAHDFNNILFPIIGLSEMLLEDLPEDSPERASVMEICHAAGRAGGLVDQILSFSRQSEHKKIPLRIQQVLKEATKLARATIPSNIEFKTAVRKDCGPVLADPTNIHQIVMNLVTNAFHAVEGTSGSIVVGLDEVTVSAENYPGLELRSGPYALLTVSDTGTGIPEDVLPHVFDPYFTTKPQGKGTGLGLSVVFGIIKEHGGDIRVYSEVGRGTIFRVYLPLLEREQAPEAPGEADILPTGNERVLLVDDEEPIVRMETQMLERLGYRVTAKTSSVEALGELTGDPMVYDLVITDMAMPHITGDDLARQMIAVRPDIPVILCTGFSEQMTITRANAMGIKGFLMKPVLRADMAREIRRVLDESEPA